MWCCEDETMQLQTTEGVSESASSYKKVQHNHQFKHDFLQGGAHYLCFAVAEKTAILI
jgi:hypothetical protein